MQPGASSGTNVVDNAISAVGHCLFACFINTQTFIYSQFKKEFEPVC
jgi:hypothetical protein